MSRWFEVEITASVTISVEADSKQEAEKKILNAVGFDSDIQDLLVENTEVQDAVEIDEDIAGINHIYEE